MPTHFYKRQNRFFHDAYRDGHHGWPTEGPTPYVTRFIRRTSPDLDGGVALDLGCGEGRHAILLARKKFTVHGIDVIPLAITRAKQFASRALGPRHGIRFKVGDALNLRFPRAMFDLVLDYGCFHHILKRDWKRYFENVTGVLKPGGFMILSVFSTKYKHSENEKRRRNWWVHRNHYDRFFTPASLRKAFGKYFQILDIREEAHGMKVFYHALMRKKG